MAAKRTPIYKGNIVNLAIESFNSPTCPDVEVDVEIVNHASGAAVVVVDDANRVCLVRRYRHAAKDWLWELPGVVVDMHEVPLLAAGRELEHKLGLHADVWTSMGFIFSTPGFCDETVHLFLAQSITSVPREVEDDAKETFELRWVGFDEALIWAFIGKICDAKTISGLFQAQAYVTSGNALQGALSHGISHSA